MPPLFAILAVFVFIVILCLQDRNRKRALLPPGREPTIEDVKRIAKSGDKIWAIKLYRQIYQVSLQESKSAVENLGD